jgi:hypothetical protein
VTEVVLCLFTYTSCLFVCCLFHDPVSNLDHIASNDSVIMNCEGCVRKRSWPNFKAQSHNLLGGTEEIYECLTHDSRCPV